MGEGGAGLGGGGGGGGEHQPQVRLQFLVTSASLHRLLVLGVERCRMSHLAAHGDGTATCHIAGGGAATVFLLHRA